MYYRDEYFHRHYGNLHVDTRGLPLSESELVDVVYDIDHLPWPDEPRINYFLCVWYDLDTGLKVGKEYPRNANGDGCVPCGVFEFRVDPQELIDQVAETVARYAREGDLDDWANINWAPMYPDDWAVISARRAFIRKAKQEADAA